MNAPSAMHAPPMTYSLPRRRYLSSVTTAVVISPIQPVTGKAKLKNQPPPVARSMYSKYSPMAAKLQGTKTTGFGLRNQSGSTNRTYPTFSAPATNPDQLMRA